MLLMQVGAIKELVRLGCAVDVKDSVASTPMHVAAGEGHLEAILQLVQLVRTNFTKPCDDTSFLTGATRSRLYQETLKLPGLKRGGVVLHTCLGCHINRCEFPSQGFGP